MLLTLWKSAVRCFLSSKNSLDALCKRLGVDLTSRNDGHGAFNRCSASCPGLFSPQAGSGVNGY